MYLFIVAVSSRNVSSYQFTLAFSSALANPVTDSKPVQPHARGANKGIASNTQNMSCIKDKEEPLEIFPKIMYILFTI